MTPFEFLLVLYAVLAGLGLTLLVRSVGQIIEARSQVRLYWIHTIWLGLIFVAHITSWFAFWHFRSVADWSVLKFLLVFSVPTLLYLVSHICVPEVYGDERSYDMRTWFYQRHAMLLGLLAFTIVLMLLNEWLLLGSFPSGTLNYFRAISLVILLVGCISGRPSIHGFIAVTMLGLLLVGVIWLNKPMV